MDGKQAAALKAVSYVRDGMVLGLGTGSTATWAIQAIGERVSAEGLKVSGVPTSERSRDLASKFGITLVSLNDVSGIDMTIDGADEVDEKLCLIKGGGGALIREKYVALASREVVIVADDSKKKEVLGAFPLPVAVVPFGWKLALRNLRSYSNSITLRTKSASSREPFVTDDGLYILDLSMGLIEDPTAIERQIKLTPGVVDVGLFVGLATRVIFGYADGRTEEIVR